MNSVIFSLALGRVRDDFRQVAHRWRVRRNIRAMLRLDDRLLDDIGVSREEIEWAARLPLTKNAGLALRDRAYLRRKGKPYPATQQAARGLRGNAAAEVRDFQRLNTQPCGG